MKDFARGLDLTTLKWPQCSLDAGSKFVADLSYQTCFSFDLPLPRGVNEIQRVHTSISFSFEVKTEIRELKQIMTTTVARTSPNKSCARALLIFAHFFAVL